MYTVDLSMYKNETTVKKTHAYPQAKASEDCVFLEGIYGIFDLANRFARSIQLHFWAVSTHRQLSVLKINFQN